MQYAYAAYITVWYSMYSIVIVKPNVLMRYAIIYCVHEPQKVFEYHHEMDGV